MDMKSVMASKGGGSVLSTPDVVAMLATEGGSGAQRTRQPAPATGPEPRVGLG
jgi:hypothetical protein